MLTLMEKIIYIALMVITICLIVKFYSSRIKLVLKGQGNFHLDHIIKRAVNAFIVFVTQKTVLVNRPVISFVHSLVAWAFMLYIFINFAGEPVRGFLQDYRLFGTGIIGNIFRLFVDIFSVLAVISALILLFRRFIFRTKHLKIRENVLLLDRVRFGIGRDSFIVALLIIIHIGLSFIGESFILRIEGTDQWQPLASMVAGFWINTGRDAAVVFEHIAWWASTGSFMFFLLYFPISKHFHLIMGPLNYFLRPNRLSPGTPDKLDFEDENAEQFGVAKLTHLEKKLLIDPFACIMCERCQDQCPAYATSKELSPAALEINKRYFINRNAKALAKGEDEGSEFVGKMISESAVWACTSCAACADVCPTGNEPMQDILNIRRDRVLTAAVFPHELQNAFNGMERNGNPWNMGRDKRTEWFLKDSSIIVKTVEENPGFDYLYWVGCAGAYDERGQQVARAFAGILNKANVNFAVLGINENCTGDSARRAGNEYLFAAMAEANIELLNSANAKKILVTCPHCLQTLKNDYRQFGVEFEVIHHSEFIQDLLNSGSINITNQSHKKITYHDPCYLGRHNGIFREPRYVLDAAGMEIDELKRTRNRSFCCGAGGANMWKEEEPGEEPIRHNRLKEAMASGADTVCTGCPFCITMLTDAQKELDAVIDVKDIAEVVAERI